MLTLVFNSTVRRTDSATPPVRPPVTETGYLYVRDMFDVDPEAQGTTYYFDPDATGTNTGLTHANAFNTAAHINSKNFSVGDSLLFLAGSKTLVTEKIRNTTMVGGYQNPFYVGAYHLESGVPVRGLGGDARPIIEGLDSSDFDPYQGGSMTNAQLMAMIPTPESTGGIYSQGTLEGLFNWYRDVPYDLYLWIQDIHVARSGGRAFRFSQSPGGSATGLLVENVFCEGTQKQSIHLAGVFDVIIEDVGHTWTSFEKHYWNPSSNRQAATAVKGSRNPGGKYETPSNVWFVNNYVYDGWSSEGLNSNSGNRDCSFIDNFVVDQGIYGIYIDRTSNALVEKNIVIRTSRTAFDDYTGIGSPNGRGVCGIMLQNESSIGSFPWNQYSTAADWENYKTHDVLVRNNFSAGWSASWGLHSQASAKTGEFHTGREHGTRCYWYGNVSLHAVVAHHMFDTFNQAPDYQIDMTNPPRFWGNVYLNNIDMSVRTGPTDVGDLFDANYFNYTPPTDYNNGAITAGFSMSATNWDDLSYLMTTDGDGHMSEDQLKSFRADVYSRLPPTAVTGSGKAFSAYTNPTGYSMSDVNGEDFVGDNYSTTREVGAFAS